MSAITHITESIGRSLSDLAADPNVTLARRAEALSRIRASCESHVRALAVEAEFTANSDFLNAARSLRGDAR
jgi:hypothetical protein